jgi:hypothetical protein
LEFDALCAQAKLLDSRLGRPLLLGHSNAGGRNLVTRIWYPKGPISSDRLRPYSERFVHAAARLRALGVDAPRVFAYGRIAGGKLRFVSYEPVRGPTLRETGGAFDTMRLARFVLALHDQGVYLRGLNLGSVIRLADGGLGLDDVSGTRFKRRPLSRRQRARNLAILCSHPQDLAFMGHGRLSELVMAYCRAAGVSLAQAARMREHVRLQVQRRNARRAQLPDPALNPVAPGGVLLRRP